MTRDEALSYIVNAAQTMQERARADGFADPKIDEALSAVCNPFTGEFVDDEQRQKTEAKPFVGIRFSRALAIRCTCAVVWRREGN